MRWAEPESEATRVLNNQSHNREALPGWNAAVGGSARDGKVPLRHFWLLPTGGAVESLQRLALCVWCITMKWWVSGASVGSALKRHSSSQGLSKNENVLDPKGKISTRTPTRSAINQSLHRVPVTQERHPLQTARYLPTWRSWNN